MPSEVAAMMIRPSNPTCQRRRLASPQRRTVCTVNNMVHCVRQLNAMPQFQVHQIQNPNTPVGKSSRDRCAAGRKAYAIALLQRKLNDNLAAGVLATDLIRHLKVHDLLVMLKRCAFDAGRFRDVPQADGPVVSARAHEFITGWAEGNLSRVVS